MTMRIDLTGISEWASEPHEPDAEELAQWAEADAVFEKEKVDMDRRLAAGEITEFEYGDWYECWK